MENNLIHARFGDLKELQAVRIPRSKGRYSYLESHPVYIHLTVTGRCYARCKGCINAAITSSFSGPRNTIVPFTNTDPKRDAACIASLLHRSRSDRAVLCFYGGEPLLEPELILAVMAELNTHDLSMPVEYMLYTNGDLLHSTVERYPELYQKLWLISVSIDGTKTQHEQSRIGTSLNKIHAGLEAVKPYFAGTVLMWSTLREDQSLLDCFREFDYLYGKGSAHQFFWHWVETKEPFENFRTFLTDYESDLRHIMDRYIDSLFQRKILPITHINELVLYILTGKARNSSACGVELAENYDIVDGKIHSCADLPPELAIGAIEKNGTPLFFGTQLHHLVEYKHKINCYDCGVHNYCGGRCPVQAHVGSSLRLEQYCQLMRVHVAVVAEYMTDIEKAMSQGNITAQDIYDQSAFFTQFTDVTP